MVDTKIHQRAFLTQLYGAAVETAQPKCCLTPLLPPPPNGRIIMLAAGKAAGSMAEVAEGFYLNALRLSPERLCGLAVARHGYGRQPKSWRSPMVGGPTISCWR